MARSNSGNNPSTYKHLVIDTPSLQGTSNQTPKRSAEDDLDATKFVTEPSTKKASAVDQRQNEEKFVPLNDRTYNTAPKSLTVMLVPSS
jgi:hypothetical protein